MDRRETEVRGRRAGWRVAGDGPPLVLVHGLSGSSRWWDGVVPRLAERHECHVLDLPRSGAAFPPDETAEWIADWAGSAGLRSFGLVGYSLGCVFCTQLAATRPELVTALVLVAPAGMLTRRVGGYAVPLAATLTRASPSFLARITLDALRTGPVALARGAAYGARADVREQAPAIAAPTLLVWGDRDRVVPLEDSDEWLRTIPSAKLTVLHGVGHLPLAERPEELAEAVLTFLD